MLCGDITIDSGLGLTIEAGVKVQFEGRYKISVLGSIKAIGSVHDSINFADTGTGWIGIVIGRTIGNPAKDSCIFGFCSFSGARYSALKAFGPASVLVTNCLFSKNTNEVDDGGGIHSLWGAPTAVKYCRFIGNTSTGGGAAIRILQSNATIDSSTFIDNTAGDYGGAIYSLQNADNTIRINGCDFVNNSAKSGGAVFNREPNISVSRCRFINNSAPDIGGAIYSQCSLTVVTNCLFANNRGLEGGALWTENEEERIYNCTIVNNYATSRAGGIFANPMKASIITIQNTIFFGNLAATECNELGTRKYRTLSIKNCVVDGGIPQDSFFLDYPQHLPFEWVNNLTTKPHFKFPNDSAGNCGQALSSDWQLLAGSAGVDEGSGYTDMSSTDIIGNARVSGSAVDIGAYEYQYPAAATREIACPYGNSARRAMRKPFSLDPSGSTFLLTLSGRKIGACQHSSPLAASLGNGVYFVGESGKNPAPHPSRFVLPRGN